MSNAPKVSIGMPVFNGERYISSAIESILQQTFRDFELIISDNDSTDRTSEICARYASCDPRIRYMRQHCNKGAIANFNVLVSFSRGKYFKWAASDDICEPTYLQQCVKYLEENPSVVVCHCDSDMIDEFGESWLMRMPANDEEIEVDKDGKRRWAGLPRNGHDSSRPSRRFAGVLLGTRWCVDSYGLIRTDVLKTTGLYENIYGSEKVLMGELCLRGKAHQIPLKLFKQRIHIGASAYQESTNAQQQFLEARQSRPFSSTRFSLLKAHFKVVGRARLSRWERIRCYVVLLRYVLQLQKLGRVVWRAIKKQGVGGGGRRIIEAGTQNARKTLTGAAK